MSVVLIPVGVGDGTESKAVEIHDGEYMTFHVSGNVSAGYIEIQVSWDRTDPAAWRALVEDSLPKRCDVNNTSVRLRGPLVARAVRKGVESIGCTGSNVNGNRDL